MGPHRIAPSPGTTAAIADRTAFLELLWFIPIGLAAGWLWYLAFPRRTPGIVLAVAASAAISAVLLGAHYLSDSGVAPTAEYVFYLTERDVVGTWPGWLSLTCGWIVVAGAIASVEPLARIRRR